MSLANVLSPISIGAVAIKNRIFRSAHGTAFGSSMNERRIAYHSARARGGVGLSVLEALSVHPSSPLGLADLNLWSGEEKGEGYKRLIDACAPYGMKLFQQLHHYGANSIPPDGSPPWSASDIPGIFAGIVPIPMTKAMIDAVVEGFADSAVQCERFGIDGVEIHAAHGYLLAQFLSANTNRRDDEYGGSLENRSRIILEITTAIRKSVSREFIIGIRLGDDIIKGGTHGDDHAWLCRELQERGLIDYVSLTLGNYSNVDKIASGMYDPPGYELPYAELVTRKTTLPTLVAGRFGTLEQADEVICSGAADMVGMTRAHIADPDLIRKTLDGRLAEIRPCIGCNQVCVANVTHGIPLGCTVNIGAGSEATAGDEHLSKVAAPRRVAVVGGGPAGLEAARVAALRGDKVTLFEARPALGGNLLYASLAPTREPIGDILVWLESELLRLGVDVRLNSLAHADDIQAINPDRIIVATGSRPRMDGIQLMAPGEPIIGFDQPHVLSSNDLFSDPARTFEKTAVVIDDLGHYEAIAVAEYLISHGVGVTLVTTKPSLAPGAELAMMSEPALRRMTPKGLRVIDRSRVLEITKHSVIIAPTYLPTETNIREQIEARLVVYVSHNRPENSLAKDLGIRGLQVKIIGDAVSPRFLQAAMLDGHQAGASI
jgi:2,4-dienoyl-CoA reductase-like NADH-dependent reductase (Old Yellow Enzyme family)/thioredoxin reductase